MSPASRVSRLGSGRTSYPISVLIVDDHPVIRDGLRMYIERDARFRVCGEAATARDALRLAASLRPDLITVDLALDMDTGLSVLQRLRTVAPEARCLVVSGYEERYFGEQSLRAGALGFLNKRDSEHLLDALDEVHKGGRWVGAAFREQPHERSRAYGHSGEEATPYSCLSRREIEVLRLIAEGMRTREIAAFLNVGASTVETHRANLKTKLHARSGADLARIAALWHAKASSRA